jgi:hypothetical protein
MSFAIRLQGFDALGSGNHELLDTCGEGIDATDVLCVSTYFGKKG